jgi:hypothetical protein
MIMLLFLKAWEGVGVVLSARKLIGSTDPLQAEPDNKRGLCCSNRKVRTFNLLCFTSLCNLIIVGWKSCLFS